MRPRELPPVSVYAGDDGACDPSLRSALEAWPGQGSTSGRRTALAAIVAALAHARVLVPVVAHLEESNEPDPCRPEAPVGEKVASAAMVTLAGPDGRPVVPVFSSVTAVVAWRPDARPVPVDIRRAALAAVSESTGVIVLDPGSLDLQLPRPAVWALGQGVPWLPALEDPEVQGAVRAAALRGAARVLHAAVGVDVEPGDRAEVRVTLTLPPGLSREEIAGITDAVGRALAAETLVAERVDSIELRLRAS